MCDGDEDMEKTMLEMLLAELPEEVALMQSLLLAQDWEELSKGSHKMKSTLAFVGNDAMTAANRDIELFAKSKKQLHRVEGLMSSLQAHLPDVLRELKAVLNG